MEQIWPAPTHPSIVSEQRDSLIVGAVVVVEGSAVQAAGGGGGGRLLHERAVVVAALVVARVAEHRVPRLQRARPLYERVDHLVDQIGPVLEQSETI